MVQLLQDDREKSKMKERSEFYSMGCYGWHKGFYNDDDCENTLLHIRYSDYGEVPDDDMFAYDSVYSLLRGGCHVFALSLQKVLGYNAYIIQGNNKVGFHAFCQIYKKGKWYYIDARGITTSFDEFMKVAGSFVSDEFTIRPIDSSDIEEWKKDDNYFTEACLFAEAVIKEYKECYTL